MRVKDKNSACHFFKFLVAQNVRIRPSKIIPFFPGYKHRKIVQVNNFISEFKLGKTFPTMQVIYSYCPLTEGSSSNKHIVPGYQIEFHRRQSLHYSITAIQLG